MSIYDYTFKDGKGNEISMQDYKGKVLLIVNTATGCGFTPQYKGIEELYEKYNKEGFEVLDFPCNQFGNQAPESNDEIHEFCTLKYNTKFPQMAKIEVNGENELPLYTFIKQQMPNEEVKGIKAKMTMKAIEKISISTKKIGDIKWNFTKFIVDRQGNVVARFSPVDTPNMIEEKIKELI